MTSTDARARLIRLQAERLSALEAGVQEPSVYMARLSEAIAQARVEYTMTAVTEIASLRTALSGLPLG